MTAALDRIGTALTARPATAFFDALTAVDEHLARVGELAWRASFAPDVTTYAQCCCGAVFEIRGTNQIEATADEKTAAADAVADMLGRGLMEVDRRIVARVIDTINGERAQADYEALRDWEDAHADCEPPS